MSKNDGGPAFPLNGGIEQLESPEPVQGMTLRDYFAAKAMQAQMTALCASTNISSMERTMKNIGVQSLEDLFSVVAYRQADAMLKARGE